MTQKRGGKLYNVVKTEKAFGNKGLNVNNSLQNATIDLIYYLRSTGLTYDFIARKLLLNTRSQVKLIQQRAWYPNDYTRQKFFFDKLNELKQAILNDQTKKKE